LATAGLDHSQDFPKTTNLNAIFIHSPSRKVASPALFFLIFFCQRLNLSLFLIRQIDSDDRFSAKTAFPPCARA